MVILTHLQQKDSVVIVGEELKQQAGSSYAAAGNIWVHQDGTSADANCTKTKVETEETPETPEETQIGTGVQFNTDLMGLIRLKMQSPDVASKILYLILYIAMVIYTCMFTFYYLKRVLTMAFLTLISPLVALTYPIDKLRDGKAQAFDMWLKEYVFNALLQPFHLIIYSIFVSSAIDLAAKNPLIAIVALAFLTPAEKILRKFFGFEKASTAGALGAAASAVGGAAAYKALGNAINRGAKGSKGGNNNVRTKDKGRIEDPDSPSGLDGYTGKGQLPPEDKKEEPEEKKKALEEAVEEAQRRQQEEELRRQQEELIRQQEALQRELDAIDYADDPEYYSQRQAELEDLQRGEALEGEQPQLGQMPTDGGKNDGSQQSGQPIRTQPDRDTTVQPIQTPLQRINPDEPRVDRTVKVTRGIRGGLIGAGKAIKNQASTTLGNKQWRAKTGTAALRTAGHVALRTGTAAAVGALGVAAGIAGDEPEDIFKYGLGGAVLGGTVGGNMAINAAEGIARSAPVQGFIEGFTGKNSTERTLERQKNDMINDVNFQRQIQQTYQPDGRELSGKELKEATAKAADLVNYGIEPSQLAKALKVEHDIKEDLDKTDMAEAQKEELAKTQAATAMKMANKIKDPTKLADEQYSQRLVDNWTKTIMKKNSALTEKEAKQNAEQMMKRVKKIHKMS